MNKAGFSLAAHSPPTPPPNPIQTYQYLTSIYSELEQFTW